MAVGKSYGGIHTKPSKTVKNDVKIPKKHQKQPKNEQGTETEWGVGDDGDNVEIRSKHLKKSDFGALKAFMAFIKKQGYEVSGGTSAHVHVGVPKNFDYFDLLAMLTLVDEKKLVSDEGPGRLFGEWAKLRDGIEKQFSDKLKYSETLESGEEVIYDRSKMREFISVVAKKYSGTNISAFFEHGTVEFRYFSSRMINKPDTFLRWIEYFMLLPRVAMKRNKFEFAGYTFVREGNNEIKVVKGKKASTSNRKASDLKTTVPPPQLSKLDPKEKQVLKYLEKYKSKAEEVGGIEQKVSEKFAKGVRENWKNPPCVKVDYTNDVSQVSAYIAKYSAKNEDSPNIVTGRVWSCSQSVSDSVKVFKKDEQFNKFWYQVGSEMMRRKVIASDFFSICEFRFTSLIAWFTDVRDYIFSKLREVFQPCNFYRRSLGYPT